MSQEGWQQDLAQMESWVRAAIPEVAAADTAVVAQRRVVVLPDLLGKLNGSAIRVPTPNVSCVDLKFLAKRNTSAEEVNATLQAASENELKGVLGYSDEPLVSTDYNHEQYSSSVAALETQVTEGNFVRVMSWYDNEWGFSCRMLDTAIVMGKHL